MRLTITTLLAALLAGPWTGCDRNLDPVTPPAEPPAERAPTGIESPSAPPDGILLLTATRKLG